MKDVALKPAQAGPTGRALVESTGKRQAPSHLCDACATSPQATGSCCGAGDDSGTRPGLGHDLSTFRTHSDGEPGATRPLVPSSLVTDAVMQGKAAPRIPAADIVGEENHPSDEDRGREPQLQRACASHVQATALAGPNDALEQEADHVADRALQVLARAAPAPDAAAPAGPRPPDRHLQREMDPDEAEAEAAAAAEPELEPAGEAGSGAEGDEGEEKAGHVQAKRSDGLRAGPSRAALRAVYHRIDGARGRGRSIDEPLRERMERALGADFSGIRVHTGAEADALTSSVRALAFTSGSDLFFADGHYAPQSPNGQRLLAHELAHVVQQGAAPSVRSLSTTAAAGTVQRKPDSDARTHGVLYFFAAGKDEHFAELNISNPNMVKIGPGFYDVRITRSADGYELHLVGGRSYSLTVSDPNTLKANLMAASALRLYMLAADAPAGDPDPQKQKKPSVKDPTGPSPGQETQTEKPGGTGTEPKKGEEQKEQKDKPGEGKTGTPGGTGTGSGTGTGMPPGSKYGWLGVFHLPPELARLLEKAIDVLGSGDEIIAFRETVQAVLEIAKNREQLLELFKDESMLLEIALGLKENKAVDKIQEWALKDTTDPKPAKNANFNGIIGLAAKITRLVRRVRRLLKPIFTVRSTVQSAIGGLGLLLEEIPALEQLLELTKNASKGGGFDVSVATEQVAAELAGQLRTKLAGLPTLLKTTVDKLANEDLVTYEEIARGFTSAIIAGLPRHYKWIGKAARAIGLEKAIADNLVKHAVDPLLYNAINETIRSVFKLAQPVFNAAVDNLTKIVAGLESGLAAELPAAISSGLKPASKPGGALLHSAPAEVARVAQASAGEPLDDDVRTMAQTRLGYSFSAVRVHRGVAANELTERLNANALTFGQDIFFGPGRFAPDSEAGRRLLHHELSHVAQQADPRRGLDLQFDYKDLLARLAKRISAAALKELKGATAPTAAKKTEAVAIKDRVEKLRGRRVESRTNPALPTGYNYIPKTGAKIKTIRRTLAWIRFIPALTIDKNNRIQLTATLSSFDPKAAARAMLRRALGCGTQQEAHHVVPLEELFHPVVQTAVKNGWKFNRADNGLCISNKIHSGSHPRYTADVRKRLDRMKVAFGTDWTKLQKPFLAEVGAIKNELRKRRRKLD